MQAADKELIRSACKTAKLDIEALRTRTDQIKRELDTIEGQIIELEARNERTG